MLINSLFLPTSTGQGTGGLSEGSKMGSAGYLFSDIMKVQLGSSPDASTGNLLTGTAQGTVMDMTQLMSLLQSLLSGFYGTEISGKGVEGEGNIQSGETSLSLDEMQELLSMLATQINAGLVNQQIPNQNGEVQIPDAEEIKEILGDNKALLITIDTGTATVSIDLKKISAGRPLSGMPSEMQTTEPEKNISATVTIQKHSDETKSIANIADAMAELSAVKDTSAKQPEVSFIIHEPETIVESEKTLSSDLKLLVDSVNKKPETTVHSQNVKPQEVKNPSPVDTTKNAGEVPLSNSVDSNQEQTLMVETRQNANQSNLNPVKTSVSAENKLTEPISADVTSIEVETQQIETPIVVKPDSQPKPQQKNEAAQTQQVANVVAGESKNVTTPETVKTVEVKAENTNVKAEPVAAVKTEKTENDKKTETSESSKTVSAGQEQKVEMKTETDSNNFNFNEKNINREVHIKQEYATSTEGKKFEEILGEKTQDSQFTKGESFKTARISDVVKEISNYIQRQDRNSLTIKVEPEHLGKVKITLDMIENSVQANIEVENEMVKKVVENNMRELQSSMSRNGIQLASLNISLQNADQKTHKQFQGKKKSGGNNTELETPEIINEKQHSRKNLGYNTVEFMA